MTRLLKILALLALGLLTTGGKKWTPWATASGAAPSTFSDDFNRSGEVPLSGGGNWTATGLGDFSDVYLLSDGALGTNSGTITDGLARVSTGVATFTSNQSATVTIRASNVDYVGPSVRVSAGGAGYHVYQEGSSAKVYKSTGTAGGNTFVGSSISITPAAAGETLTLEATGTSTVTLTVKINGVSAGSVTDSSSPLSGGQPGFWVAYGFYIEAFSATDI